MVILCAIDCIAKNVCVILFTVKKSCLRIYIKETLGYTP